jgi:molybdate transport repressor ModE-like protein
MTRVTSTHDHLSVAGKQRPRLKVWLELDGEYSFGWGICEILQAVEATGSIKSAAGSLGKSYRYVWGRIKDAERTLGQPLVTTQVGGRGTDRSSLTEFAKQSVGSFVRLRDRLFEFLEQEFAQEFG